jgi:hypothetical protein
MLRFLGGGVGERAGNGQRVDKRSEVFMNGAWLLFYVQIFNSTRSLFSNALHSRQFRGAIREILERCSQNIIQ